MANQEVGHATLLTNMLGEAAPKQCVYNYPYTTVREWLDFNQRVTRWGESGVWGFLSHLDSREVSQMLSQSVAIEARQQMAFRQVSGLAPMPVWFENGWPQSWAWTMLAPYISYCPEDTTRLAWENIPTLHILNNPNINRLAPNETEQDGNEAVGDRIADPSISNITDSESCINAEGIGKNFGAAMPQTGPSRCPIQANEFTLNGMVQARQLGPTTHTLLQQLRASPSLSAGAAS